MNYPSFIGKKEQSKSELLYNKVKILMQTNVKELIYDVDFGTDIRSHLKQGISNIVIGEIKEEILNKLNNYLGNELEVTSLIVKQNDNKLFVNLEYTELSTGKVETITAEEVIENKYLD